MKRSHTIFIASAIIFGVAVYVWKKSSSDSGASMAVAEAACESWLGGELDSEGNTTIFGSWRKNGKIVVEVGYNPQGATYSTRLCVYDPQTRDLESPGAFGRTQWEK